MRHGSSRRNDTRWNPHCRGPGGNIREHDRIGADASMIANGNSAQNLGPSAHVHMFTEARCARALGTRPQRHLMQQKAIRPDDGVRVNDNPIRMDDEQATANPRIQRDVRTGHNGPESMAQYRTTSKERKKRPMVA